MDTNARLPKEKWEHASAPADDWRNLILESAHEDEVLALVREHIARWSPAEIARLPCDCRPGRIRDAEDVSRWAFTLASTHCSGTVSRDDEALLDRLLEFVTHAAVRLAALKGAMATAESGLD